MDDFAVMTPLTCVLLIALLDFVIIVSGFMVPTSTSFLISSRILMPSFVDQQEKV